MTTTDQIAQVRKMLSTNALETLEQVAHTTESQDEMIASDLGVWSLGGRDKFLARCLDGTDASQPDGPSIIDGWTEYVGVIERVAAGHYHQGR